MKKTFTLAVALLVLLSATACTSKAPDVSDVGYKVGVGSYTSTSKSTPYSGTTNGKSAVTTTYVTAIFDSANVIKRVYIDAVESNVYFDAMGQLVPNSEGEAMSKRDLGDAYNMKPASAIGKEWHEQINSLEKYLEGKNITEISSDIGMSGYDSMTRKANVNSNAASSGAMGSDNSGMMSSSDSGIIGDIASDIMGGGSSISSGTMTDSSYNSSSSMNSGMTSESGGASGSGGAMWQEDLKSSVTIDISNIQRALKKAYENAR